MIVAAGLLMVATWWLFQTESKNDHWSTNGRKVSPKNSVDGSSSYYSDNLPEAKSERRRRTDQTIEKIRNLGYQFSADRVRERSAAGNVTVTSPEGLIFKSEYVSISSDGDYIYFEGDILVEGDSKGRSFTMKYTGERAYAKIAVNGDSMVFEGDGMLVTRAPKSDEQNKSE